MLTVIVILAFESGRSGCSSVRTCNLKSNIETFYTLKRQNMFDIPSCQPATELYGSLEAKHYAEDSAEISRTLEQRLQLLGMQNSVVQGKLDIKTLKEANNPNKEIVLTMDSFESISFKQKLVKDQVMKKKCSARLWLWHHYLSRYGNCSLCERPLNGLYEDVIMLTCAHAVHPECAEEIHQNRGGCRRCEISEEELANRKRKRRNDRNKCIC